MQIEHHDLCHEFPDMCDAIVALKRVNGHFASLFSRYDHLTARVESLEEHDLPVSDFTFEDLKKQRVKLKDEIYYLLIAFRAGQKNP